ncbi:MAG: sugar ABC transporter ATP-binding protein, partial [Erysipelotrichales bacterium]|nr:sugar ABC transporter ATP-binding protein [Erysipelotrichales bacterium]
MEEYILDVRDICKSFPGVKALDHAQLKVRPGTVHSLMGENGAGKSTLMKCLFGIYKRDKGDVIYCGKKVNFPNAHAALQEGIAMVHQELQPIPERSVAENIFCGRYPMKLGGLVVDHAKMNAMTAELLKEVRLNVKPTTRLGDLSVSQMQS